MNEYLIGIMFHEPEAWRLWHAGVIEDYESSTGLFVEADSLGSALSWAEQVGEKLLRFVNNDNTLQWKDSGYYCWYVPDVGTSGWSHCVSFFQHVRAGVLPELERMTSNAYENWSKENQ